MKREWNVQRSCVGQPDGQYRWDLAYQCLLKWAKQSSPTQEVQNESGTLRSGFDSASTTQPDD